MACEQRRSPCPPPWLCAQSASRLAACECPGAPRWLLSGTSWLSFRPLLTLPPGVVFRAMGSGRPRRLLPLTAAQLSPVSLTEKLQSQGSRNKAPGRLLQLGCTHSHLQVYYTERRRRWWRPLLYRKGRRRWRPLQYSCLENPMDGEAWWAAVHGVARSRTRLSDLLSLFTFMHWRRKWQPTPVFLPGESQGQGAWWAAVYGVAQSRTRLK